MRTKDTLTLRAWPPVPPVQPGHKLISLGPALERSSLSRGQEKHTIHMPEVQIGDSGYIGAKPKIHDETSAARTTSSAD